MARVKDLHKDAGSLEKPIVISDENSGNSQSTSVRPDLQVPSAGPVEDSRNYSQTQQKTEKPVNEKKTTFNIWENARIARFLDALVKGKFAEIQPVIDISVEGGVVYPDIDELLKSVPGGTTAVLESLVAEEILIKEPFEKLHIDPEGSFQLVPVDRCPHCGSGNLDSGKLIEHFACGNIAFEKDYKRDYKYICSKCNRELKLLGTDYHYVGKQYKCLDCSELFPTPVIKWRSLKTGKIWDMEELRDVRFHSYSVNADKNKWLEFQLKPKVQLVDFLKLRGYEVEELAQIQGKSGATHIIDILATRDDVLAKFQVGIGILTPMHGEEKVCLEDVFNFDTSCYDGGISYKCIIALPKLAEEALKFAERQNIIVFESDDMENMVSFIIDRASSLSAMLVDDKPVYNEKMGTVSWTRAKLAAYLRNRGYEVNEGSKLIGRSGAEYTFDIFAQRNDVIVSPTLVVALADINQQHEVSVGEIALFDAEAYDAGIRNKTFISVNKITSQAMQFASQQRIVVVDSKELKGLLRS